MATIYDVARHAAVSPATVSRVLNGRASVDAGLADRVRRAMTDLDYRPSAVARNLRRSRSSLWAVIVPDIARAATMLRAVEEVAQPAGFLMVLCSTDDDPVRERRYVDDALAEQVAGVIISPTGAPPVRRLLDAATAVVVVEHRLPELAVDTVLVDEPPPTRPGSPTASPPGSRPGSPTASRPGSPPAYPPRSPATDRSAYELLGRTAAELLQRRLAKPTDPPSTVVLCRPPAAPTPPPAEAPEAS